MSSHPIPDSRGCGGCTACCVALKFDTPELRKDANVPCPHLVAGGCGIYGPTFIDPTPARPQTGMPPEGLQLSPSLPQPLQTPPPSLDNTLPSLDNAPPSLDDAVPPVNDAPSLDDSPSDEQPSPGDDSST